MLKHDPRPWLMQQEGTAAVRARRRLRLERADDQRSVQTLLRKLAGAQSADGSFKGSFMNTAGHLKLLADLRVPTAEGLTGKAAEYLFGVLASQPGYRAAERVRPGSLRTEFDLCGFFGPYEARNQPDVLAAGAREMNFYRLAEPLLGPKAPVRAVRRSSLDRPGPGSCYAWGLVPLCYVIESLCWAGHAADGRLRPAVNALLGAQRNSGGWCRGLGGHASCTLPALRTMGAHPALRSSDYAERAAQLIRRWPRKLSPLLIVQSLASIDRPVAHQMAREALDALARSQRRNGTFGDPHPVERVLAILTAEEMLT
jgi:hypothetical protein